MAKKDVIRKMTGNRVDPDTAAALSIVEMEQNKEQLRILEQQHREKMIAQTHEMVGQIRAANMFSKFANVSNLVWLKQVKETQIYKDLPGLGTWDKFCEYIGISRQKADLDLQNLAAFGEDFLLTVGGLNVGYRDLRKLRQLTFTGDIVIEAEGVTIGEERIPLDNEHAEDLQAAIEALLEEKNKRIEEDQATLRAKDKVLKDKEKLLNRQAKDLARYEGRAEKAGLTAEEEAVLQDLDNSRTIIDGFLMKYDPEKNPLPEGATVRMRAKMMHTLDYFKRIILATYDTAADLYGEPEIDDDWLPPHLRAEQKRVQKDAAAPDPACDEDWEPPTDVGDNGCASCNFHKAKMNPTPGVLIPGRKGKCTKPGGLCEIYQQED